METAFDPSWRRSGEKNIWTLGLMLLMLAGMSAVRADLVVTENIGKGTEEKWPKKPDLAVVEDPHLAGAPQGVNAKTRVGQSFTPARSFTLDKMLIRYKAGAGAGKFTIRIQEVPEGPDALLYAEGADLFPEPLTFECTVNTGDEARFLELKFGGSSKIVLASRKTYIVEIIGLEGPGLAWLRRAADEYPKGRAYIDRHELSGNDDDRDLSLAIYGD
jgi:hypothetical protein